jgi:hemerythrin
MALVTWSDKLSVGVKSIDTQHTVLFNSINELHAAMLKGQARTVVGGLLCDLLVYTRSHFSAEEALMASTGYPGLPVHHAKHIHLTKQVEEYVARFEKGDITLSHHLASFLSDWLLTHIQQTDREYGPWLNEHGVS